MGLLILVSGIYFWSGSYNIAATDSHFELVRLGMTTIRDRSIGLRAGEMAVHRIESATAMAGFPPYHGLCSICHAAPGLEASPIRQGLNPKPPLLNSESVQQRSDAELFWILKHGIKMTGMPAFGPTHDDHELWQIIAFVRQLPRINEKEYLSMVRTLGTSERDEHGHDHTHRFEIVP